MLNENEEDLIRQIQNTTQDEDAQQDQSTDETHLNYDVYNGLNLLNEDLGQSYIMEGFNPFGDNFVLDEDFILDTLENNVEKYEISTPDFIEAGNKETIKAFELSAKNALDVIELLNEHIANPNTPEIVRKQMRKQIVYILCRNQLIKVYLKKIKDEKDTLLMYQKLSAINWQLSKTMQDLYNKQFKAKKVAEELAKIAKEKAETESKRHNINLEKAKDILNKNKRNKDRGAFFNPIVIPLQRERQPMQPTNNNTRIIEPRVQVNPGQNFVEMFRDLNKQKEKSNAQNKQSKTKEVSMER